MWRVTKTLKTSYKCIPNEGSSTLFYAFVFSKHMLILCLFTSTFTIIVVVVYCARCKGPLVCEKNSMQYDLPSYIFLHYNKGHNVP